jgi:hypothetical protein
MLSNGNILVFDNGLTRGWSRVLDLNPFSPKALVQYAPSGAARFFDRVMGSCQRLPNGKHADRPLGRRRRLRADAARHAGVDLRGYAEDAGWTTGSSSSGCAGSHRR